MAGPFDSFVILADMRTGSNALEERLNDYAGVRSHGEIFNPSFIGKPKADALFGLTREDRDADPHAMLDALDRNTEGLAGFRLFSDHDLRAFELCMRDRKRGKVVLLRDPLESYISLKIARKTGQWWLGDLKSIRAGQAYFDTGEFQRYLAARGAWLGRIRRRLQTTGQTAFEIGYDEINDGEVIAGLARYLGAGEHSGGATRKGRVQNPQPMSEKVSNFDEMKRYLQSLDPFDIDAIPSREPDRGPNVPSFVAARSAPLLYMPLKCAEDSRVSAWMAALDGCAPGDLETGFTRRTLRNWKRQRGAHFSFTVVSHPVERAHEAFCRFILPTGPAAFTGIRDVLVRSYRLPLPDDPEDASYDIAAHRSGFLAFLEFLKGNLAGQTAIRIDAAWASQERSLRGLADFGIPDAVLRSGALARDLEAVAGRLGVPAPPMPEPQRTGPFGLEDIYDASIERAARAAYQRDYMMFGFGTWL